MPLHVISGRDAVNARKGNPVSSWPARGRNNRFEPLARPDIQASFTLEPGSTIFTVGSCFARYVEQRLLEEGFRLPARDLFRRPEFRELQYASINNFGAPSIYNEFAWALDPERSYDLDANICEVGDDKYIDLHVLNTIRPAPLDVVVSRRTAITETYKTVCEAQTVIITLGLSEVWFDTLTSTYLNVGPLPRIMRQYPDRFQLHVLSYAEVLEHLCATIELLNNQARKPNILLTVSPVPLQATHRDMDVAVANTYSKSVLRAVAEELTCSFGNVFYYPSYESVMITDRKLAWEDDQVHVTSDVIDLQVARMIKAYAQKGGVDLRDKILERLQSGPRLREATRLFEDYRDIIAADEELLRWYLRVLIQRGEPQVALDLMSDLEVDGNIQPLKVQALRKLKEFGQAMIVLETSLHARSRNHALWQEALETYIDQSSVKEALEIVDQWVSATPGAAGMIYRRSGKVFERLDSELAYEMYQKSLEQDPESDLTKTALDKLNFL
ncbi:GSCFA domain-containing protein [Pseudovibrio sp. WM33]|uniref:GSCFA domain-containing protein n=1 Tax=Pseudovibrio sp. WM33 TaxID=1735585 RepID=UPI0007AEAFD1|nr:GSCFA domain-containing protein [Pseudovibrio sp. WM33]KZL17489.1 GSCFA family protein [Pseudovibrio sp. WM33]